MNISTVIFNGSDKAHGGHKTWVAERNWKQRTLHDKRVINTLALRQETLKALMMENPEQYMRFQLASQKSYRDGQIFCAQITGQDYCEIRPNVVGGTETSIPYVSGGLVRWYTHQYNDLGGYETLCQIVLPENWEGDLSEAQKWIDFVDQNIAGKAKFLRQEEVDYFDYLLQIPELSWCTSVLGYSPLSYQVSSF